MWLVGLAFTMSAVSSSSYIALYFILSNYQHKFTGAVTELPVLMRVILNIYQSYLSVFVLISVALLVLFFIKIRRGNYKITFVLIVFNCVFASVLLAISFSGITV